MDKRKCLPPEVCSLSGCTIETCGVLPQVSTKDLPVHRAVLCGVTGADTASARHLVKAVSSLVHRLHWFFMVCSMHVDKYCI